MMSDRLVAPNAEAHITSEEFARRTQVMHDAAYPLVCPLCGRREEERRDHTLSDGRTVVVGCYCRCEHYKGPAIASPMENHRASQAVRALSRGPRPERSSGGPESVGDLARELVVPAHPATPTHVAASSPDRERPSPPLSPERRFSFLSACAKLGADEHRIRCELAARGEELEECSEAASTAVYRQFKSESPPRPAQEPAGTTAPIVTLPCTAPEGVGGVSDWRSALTPEPAPASILEEEP